MRKLSVLFLALLLIASEGISQTYDTICIPANQLKSAILKVEEAKILREELNLTKLQMVNLERRLDVRDSLIWNYNRMYQLLKSDISNLELQKANDHTTIKNLEKTITLSEKAFRRQKSSAYMLGIAGIVLGVFIANY
jgi:hypothetical protein